MGELTTFNWFQVGWAFLIVLPFGFWWGLYAANNNYSFISFAGFGLPMITILSFLPVIAWRLLPH